MLEMVAGSIIGASLVFIFTRRTPPAPIPRVLSPELAMALAAMVAAAGRAVDASATASASAEGGRRPRFQDAAGDVKQTLEQWDRRLDAAADWTTERELKELRARHPDYAFAIQVLTWARELA